MKTFHRTKGFVMGVFNFGDPANRRPGWSAARWPVRRDAGPAVRSSNDPVMDPVQSPTTDRHPRVLVVDDNPVHRMLTSEMLALWGIQALLAEDGSEAVALACERPLALILMDMQMPVLDGLGATRQIRAFERERGRARVPIVAYTSGAYGGRMWLQDFGLDGLLAKPCEAHELHECLRRWCPEATVDAAFAGSHDEVRVDVRIDVRNSVRNDVRDPVHDRERVPVSAPR
jgi:CheY-like chemotaxis protein